MRRTGARRNFHKKSPRNKVGKRGKRDVDLQVLHAIAPVAFRRDKLHRSRLVDQLLSNISRKLIVVAAPAGYGKTTLLSDFAAHVDMPVCWLRIHEGIGDAIGLARVLDAALTQRFRRLRRSTRVSSLAGLSPQALARVLGESVETSINEPFAILVDDVHVVNQSREAIAFFDSVVESFPSYVTIIAAGREPPELSLARLMAEGNLAGIGPQDLALTREELDGILALAGRSSGHRDSADELLETTRGWITGVLLSQEVERMGVAGSTLGQRPMVFEYLASVVLSRLPEDLRRFMQESSVLRTMDASSCNDLLDAKGSDAYLTQLVKKGLFVTVSEELPRSYQYHPLLRELLLNELETLTPARFSQLRVKAAKYYAKQGAPEEAFGLYIDAGRPAQAKKIAEAHARELYKAGRYRTLELWSEQIRRGGFSSILLLRLVATTHVDGGRLDKADSILKEIDSLVSPRTPSDARGAIENLRGLIALRKGDLNGARVAVTRAQRFLERGAERYLHLGMSKRLEARALSSGGGELATSESLAKKAVKFLELAREEFPLAQALIDLFGFQLLGGKPIEAWHSITRAQHILERYGSPLPLAICAHNVAVLLHQQGRVEEALLKFVEAVRLAHLADAPVREAQAMFSQADLFCDLRLYRQAAEVYELALDLASASGDTEPLAFGCLRIAVLHRRAGNPALAEAWLARSEGFTGRTGPNHIGVALQRAILQVLDSPQESGAILAELIAGKYGSLDVYDLVLARFALSYAWDRQGAMEEATIALRECLTTARTTGSEQAIVGEANCTEWALEYTERVNRENADVTRILERVRLMRGAARQFEQLPDESPQLGKLVVRGFARGSIRYSGSELKALRPLHRDILHYIVDRERADRDQMAEEFWPDHQPGRQAANLHMAIYNLRKALGRDSLVFDGRFYSLAESLVVEYDVAKFERAASTALRLPPGDPRRYFALTEAVNSYGGRFLENLDYSWCSNRRRSLESVFLELADLFAEEGMRRGNTATAIDVLGRALVIDPLRDSLNMKYLEALAMLGRRQELVRHYSRYVKLLSEELGLDPSPEVRSAYMRMIS